MLEHRASPRVILRNVAAGDVDFLYAVATAAETGFRWRWHGSVPSPGDFLQQLWTHVLSQFVVARAGTGERVGLVVCHDANHSDGWAYLAAVSSPLYLRSGLIIEGAVLLIDEVFRNWNFRKLYMEAPEFNIDQVRSSLGKWFHEEGRLRGHHFYDGAYHDHLLLALYRDEYERAAPFIREAMFGDSGSTGIGLRTRALPKEVLDLDDFCSLLADEFDRETEPGSLA